MVNINGLGIQSVDRYASQAPQRQRVPETASNPEQRENARSAPIVVSAEDSRQRAQRWQQLNTVYDEPPQSSRRALEAYQGVQLNERKEEVKSMFGVDLYA